MPIVFVAFILMALPHLSLGQAIAETPTLTLNNDGAWSWFEDERAIVTQGMLLVGSVAQGIDDPARRGNIEVVTLNLSSRQTTRAVLHQGLEADDHNSPALWVRPDGRILAFYCKHGPENKIYYRLSTQPHDGMQWEKEQVFVPSASSRVTYSNLYALSEEAGGQGRLYNFFRGLDNHFKPSWSYSDTQGDSWHAGGLLIDVPSNDRHRPYVKYGGNNRDTIHFVFTEGHPRNFDNSLFHAYYHKGHLYRTDGSAIHALAKGPITPSQASRIFQGDRNNVAWIHDMSLDSQGHPQAVYSVQKNSAGLPPGQGGSDHRYRLARWNGQTWLDQEIAHAGNRLYAGEDDYTGGICLHPNQTGTVFISTDVDPITGKPLSSGHYEIYQGRSGGEAKPWQWMAVTRDSKVDNLRPIVPHWESGKTALLWLRGNYSSYTRYQLAVMGQIRLSNGSETNLNSPVK